MTNAEDLLIFKLREKGRNAKIEEKPSAIKENPAAQVVGEVEAERAAEKKRQDEARNAAKLAKARKKGGKEELEGAKGKYCEWHPWRSAYAVCDYCHRPFCYEDTVEYGRRYYCLEDIDKVSETYNEEMYAEYNSISFVAAGLFMLAFVVFVYFASGQIAYIISYGRMIGLPAFLANINYSYGSALLGLALMLLGLMTSVLIFTQSAKGFVVGLLAGLADTVLFSYQFLNSGTLYMALLSAMALSALLLLAYSKISYQVPEQSLDERSLYYGGLPGKPTPIGF